MFLCFPLSTGECIVPKNPLISLHIPKNPLKNMTPGKLIIFSAPSGSGKTTLVRYLLSQGLDLAFSVSCTSRAPRGTEQDGVDYYFLTPEEYFQFVAQANGMTQEETDERLKPFEHFMQGEILGQKKLIRDRCRCQGRRQHQEVLWRPCVEPLRAGSLHRGTVTSPPQSWHR